MQPESTPTTNALLSDEALLRLTIRKALNRGACNPHKRVDSDEGPYCAKCKKYLPIVQYPLTCPVPDPDVGEMPVLAEQLLTEVAKKSAKHVHPDDADLAYHEYMRKATFDYMEIHVPTLMNAWSPGDWFAWVATPAARSVCCLVALGLAVVG